MYPERTASDMEIMELENQILRLKVRLFENEDVVRQKNILIQNLNSNLQYCQKQIKIMCMIFSLIFIIGNDFVRILLFIWFLYLVINLFHFRPSSSDGIKQMLELSSPLN